MHNSRIKVEYLKSSAEPAVKEKYLLDTRSGILYYINGGERGRNYKPHPSIPGVWENRHGSIQAVEARAAAPTPDPKLAAVNENNERGAGLKFDSGKPRWTLLMQGCAKALEGVAKVLTFGAKKYTAHSWKQVENNEERYRDALYRHLNAIEGGEAVDPESGLPHWDHVACNALFLSQLNKDKGNV